MRLDNDEPTFSAHPCELHGAQAARAMETLRLMPPQEEPVSELWQRLLDQEIEPWTTTAA